jgi:hypothetical protein
MISLAVHTSICDAVATSLVRSVVNSQEGPPEHFTQLQELRHLSALNLLGRWKIVEAAKSCQSGIFLLTIAETSATDRRLPRADGPQALRLS